MLKTFWGDLVGKIRLPKQNPCLNMYQIYSSLNTEKYSFLEKVTVLGKVMIYK